jgi:hypothetical protein
MSTREIFDYLDVGKRGTLDRATFDTGLESAGVVIVDGDRVARETSVLDFNAFSAAIEEGKQIQASPEWQRRVESSLSALGKNGKPITMADLSKLLSAQGSDLLSGIVGDSATEMTYENFNRIMLNL